MRIALIASCRHPVAEPFAGGLEMITHALATSLGARHDVHVFASGDSDAELQVEPVCERAHGLRLSDSARNDASMPGEWFLEEHHAYLQLMLRLADDDFDIVHNHSLHYLPISMSATLTSPMVTTLHTPPTPWLESALRARTVPSNDTFVSVSHANAAAWGGAVEVAEVIHNGVALDCWPFAAVPEWDKAVWTGRIVPEKGPHLAIDAAHRAGMRIMLAGPIGDQRYFEAEVRPRLGAADRHLGHLTHRQLGELVSTAAVQFNTPCWDEPFGLVVAESLACGTPVATFARGAMAELLDDDTGRLARAGDVDALADAAREARQLDRGACRSRAEHEFSFDVMVGRYERLYERLAPT